MSSSFQNWLSQVTQPYVYPSHVAAEVDFTLRTFHSLRPQSSLYTLSDGNQSNLLNLVGSIPIVSQQNQGRVIEVPVEICLPLHYPSEVPLIWVRPGLLNPEQRALMGNLVVRQTDSVDGSGMVWGLEGFRNSRLVELISHLQNLFKYQLPVVSGDIMNMNTKANNNMNNTNMNNESNTNTYNKDTNYTIGNTKTYNEHNADNNNHDNNTNNTSNLSNSPKELLKRRVESEIESEMKECDDEMEALLKTISSLEEGESILNRERLTLNNEINLLNKEINTLDSKRTEMERLFATKMEINATSIMRSATVPADPASSQLLELISNESALMDVLYSLIKVTITPTGGEKLNLTMALRCIRELGRKHFLTKVHIRKIITGK